MKARCYLQAFTINQGEEVALLALLAAGFPLSKGSELTVKWWEGNKKHVRRNVSWSAFQEIFGKRQLNTLSISGHVEIGGAVLDGKVESVSLAVSPSSLSWNPNLSSEMAGRSVRREVMEFVAMTKRAKGTNEYPSLLEVHALLSVDSFVGANRQLAESLASALIGNVGELLPVVHAGVFPKDAVDAFESVLGWMPEDVGLLGRRFSALAPIMAASAPVCSELARAIESSNFKSCEYIGDKGGRCGVLLQDYDSLPALRAKPNIQALLARKTSTPTGMPEPLKPGELRVGGWLLRTLRRQLEVEALGIEPALEASGWGYRPLIGERFCRLLGIDPLEMVCFDHQIAIHEKFQKIAEDAFAELTRNQCLERPKDRILVAYIEAAKVCHLGEAVAEFIRENYSRPTVKHH